MPPTAQFSHRFVVLFLTQLLETSSKVAYAYKIHTYLLTTQWVGCQALHTSPYLVCIRLF